jgi:hypothetical protein
MSTQYDGRPPAKRPRLQEDNAEEPALVDVPDSEVWFRNGNVMIAAVDDSTKQRHLFKCHQGLLAHRLPALEDMFEAGAMANSASASETHAGLPIVRLYDPYDHVRSLLRVLYNPRSVPIYL